MALVRHKVESNQAFLFVNTGTNAEPVWSAIVCQTNLQFNRTRAEIDARTKCGADYMAGTLDFQVTADGQLVINPEATESSILYLHNTMVSNTKRQYKVGLADPKPGDIDYIFSAVITQLNDTYNIDTAATFSITLRVDAETLETETTPDE